MVVCVSLLHTPQVVVYTRPYRRDAETRRGSADGVTTPREEPPGDGGRDRGRRSVRVGQGPRAAETPRRCGAASPVLSCAARLCQQYFAAKH